MQEEQLEEPCMTSGKKSVSRKIWIFAAMCCTLWIPNSVLGFFFNLKWPKFKKSHKRFKDNIEKETSIKNVSQEDVSIAESCGDKMSESPREKSSAGEEILAWREKIVLCLIVALLSAGLILYLTSFSAFLCPCLPLMSPGEFSALDHTATPHVVVHGRVYDLSKIMKMENPSKVHALLTHYSGKDASELFSREPLAMAQETDQLIYLYTPPSTNTFDQAEDVSYLSENLDTNQILKSELNTNPYGHRNLTILPIADTEGSDVFVDKFQNSSRSKQGFLDEDLIKRPKNIVDKKDYDDIYSFASIFDSERDDFYLSRRIIDKEGYLLRTLSQFWVADLAFTPETLARYGSTPIRALISLNGRIYNVSPLVDPRVCRLKKGFSVPFHSFGLKKLLVCPPWGVDKSNRVRKFVEGTGYRRLEQDVSVLDRFYFAGVEDQRSELRCSIAHWVLVGSAILVLSVTLIKFLAALQLGRKKVPERLDKHVVFQVSCFTEGEVSLRRTIDSIVNLSYDDSSKLLFVVCDGVITGVGNDRTTARIVLDILGVDQGTDSQAVVYESLGTGVFQTNRVKIFSGIYRAEFGLNSVPFIVVVKIGNGLERKTDTKENLGNRGKRDSQLILFRWLSKLFHNGPYSLLDLALIEHCVSMLGIDPCVFDFCMMVDADTRVEPDSLIRLMSVMVGDTKVIGVCGETKLANENSSWTCAVQVYEYYISHNLSKSFESLFGSVTCLPGCFCMYRLKGIYGFGDDGRIYPYLLSPLVLADYSETNTDTLHKKNLLMLGEDRYLTTLVLKHFPHLKTAYASDAICYTVAPDSWSVLLSQRRRWINSTVHNLFELLFLPQLCGFGVFSMRFVVFLDLFSTLVMPATIAYLLYLVYFCLTVDSVGSNTVPITTLFLLISTFAMQALVIILKRHWRYLLWMLYYIIALPLFGFILPLYAFWHFDDFSWGRTRRSSSCITDPSKPSGFFQTQTLPTHLFSSYQNLRLGSNQNGPGRQYKSNSHSILTPFSMSPIQTLSIVTDDMIQSKIRDVIASSIALEGAKSLEHLSTRDIIIAVELSLNIDLSDRHASVIEYIESILNKYH